MGEQLKREIEANNGTVPLFTCNARTSILRRMSKTPSVPRRTSPKFDLRLPDDMRARVAEAAQRNGRSMNSELVSYVGAALDGLSAAELAKSIQEIKAAIIAMQKRLDEK